MAKQHAPRFLNLVNDAKTRVTECTVDDVKARLAAGENFVIVDVREESEYAAAHAAGHVEQLGVIHDGPHRDAIVLVGAQAGPQDQRASRA